MRLLQQAITTIWLLYLSFYGWLLEFNKYRDPNIIDCDKGAEFLFAVFLALIWLTTLIIWGVNLMLKYWDKTKPFWFSGGLSAALSIAFIPKFIMWIQYNAALPTKCG
ncbi:hypothetical protein [Stenomitos frigidus]|uniref:Uncharacterized protein n=1 Tax=Stenomitos frigidus ULC18 TaxID=2107698 RepID=A0A2T1DU32_9CYAN|nr:hypothetical protein [Stenomitos frigidus]PSB23884.1 hypothetical protein C7B82_29335 [Stenomitos frigidus ULC18]